MDMMYGTRSRACRYCAQECRPQCTGELSGHDCLGPHQATTKKKPTFPMQLFAGYSVGCHAYKPMWTAVSRAAGAGQHCGDFQPDQGVHACAGLCRSVRLMMSERGVSIQLWNPVRPKQSVVVAFEFQRISKPCICLHHFPRTLSGTRFCSFARLPHHHLALRRELIRPLLCHHRPGAPATPSAAAEHTGASALIDHLKQPPQQRHDGRRGRGVR